MTKLHQKYTWKGLLKLSKMDRGVCRKSFVPRKKPFESSKNRLFRVKAYWLMNMKEYLLSYEYLEK